MCIPTLSVPIQYKYILITKVTYSSYLNYIKHIQKYDMFKHYPDKKKKMFCNIIQLIRAFLNNKAPISNPDKAYMQITVIIRNI